MYNNPWRDHTEAVDALAAVGIAPPKEWTQLRARFDDFTAITDSARHRLAQAVIAGNTDEIDVLRAMALAEADATPVTRATVNNVVQAQVLFQLQAIYAPHVQKNYLKVCDLFDRAVTAFTAAANIIDPEADPEAVIALDDGHRSAWATAPIAVRDVENLVRPLQEAAWLAGIANTRSDEATIALVLDTDRVSRRPLWEAWEFKGDSRCGKWSKLLALGVRICANRDLASFIEYRRPKPIEERWEPGDKRGTFTRRMHDPETELNSAIT